jgi:hypothetical protein
MNSRREFLAKVGAAGLTTFFFPGLAPACGRRRRCRPAPCHTYTGGPYACPQVYLGQTNGMYNYQCLETTNCTTIINESTFSPMPACPTTCAPSSFYCIDMSKFYDGYGTHGACNPTTSCGHQRAFVPPPFDYDQNYKDQKPKPEAGHNGCAGIVVAGGVWAIDDTSNPNSPAQDYSFGRPLLSVYPFSTVNSYTPTDQVKCEINKKGDTQYFKLYDVSVGVVDFPSVSYLLALRIGMPYGKDFMLSTTPYRWKSSISEYEVEVVEPTSGHSFYLFLDKPQT